MKFDPANTSIISLDHCVSAIQLGNPKTIQISLNNVLDLNSSVGVHSNIKIKIADRMSKYIY